MIGRDGMTHDWVPSTLGHGETMCRRCFVTNREAAALGITNVCDAPPPTPKAANVNTEWTQDQIDDDIELPLICHVTSQPCMTEQDEFCEDYGCARRAGIDGIEVLLEPAQCELHEAAFPLAPVCSLPRLRGRGGEGVAASTAAIVSSTPCRHGPRSRS